MSKIDPNKAFTTEDTHGVYKYIVIKPYGIIQKKKDKPEKPVCEVLIVE